MRFIPEAEIDQAAEQVDSAEKAEALVARMRDEQPWLLAFLTADAGPAMSADEMENLLFLALVIWAALDAEARASLPQIPPVTIEEVEERNWEILQSTKARSFSEQLNPFFDDYPQEDLLAFVEDALVQDEDSPFSPAGREPVFIRLKTMIDVTCKPH